MLPQAPDDSAAIMTPEFLSIFILFSIRCVDAADAALRCTHAALIEAVRIRARETWRDSTPMTRTEPGSIMENKGCIEGGRESVCWAAAA
jgi:hypothetical protein